MKGNSAWDTTKKEVGKAAENIKESIKETGKETFEKAMGTKQQSNHPYIAKEGPEPASGKAIKSELKGSAQQMSNEASQWAKEKVEDVKEGAQSLKNKWEEGKEFVKEKAQEGAQAGESLMEKGKQAAQDLKGKAETEAKQDADSLLATANTVVEKAQEFAQKAYESILLFCNSLTLPRMHFDLN